MRKLFHALASLLIFAAVLLFATSPVPAQEQAATATAPITTVVTVLGPKYTPPPAIAKEDVVVYTGKDRLDVTGWIPAQGDKAALELAIVIDDVTSSDLGNQFNDLRSFITSLPKTTSVGLFYADNGTTQTAAQFSADHDAVARKLRLPLGPTAASTSIYLSLMDFISRWPTSGARREIFLIADGIDRFRGDPFSPDVPATIEKAQKAGIMIHTIFASSLGHFGRNMFRLNFGQTNLEQMADGTGGEAFFQGFDTPISFGPFLEQLGTALHNQYWLTFLAPRSNKKDGELRPIQVRTEQRNVVISSATEVLVPGPR